MNRKIILTAVFWLWLSSIASGQINALAIGGPHEVKPGTLVRLVAETALEETPFWIVLSPNDLDYEQVENGRRLIFPAGCVDGQRVVVLLLAQQVKDGRIVTRQLRRTVEVMGDAKKPGVPNDPPAGSDEEPPTAPSEDWSLSPVFDATNKAMPLILLPDARLLGSAVADNFDLVAQRCIAGGEINTKAQIWKQISQLNREALGPLSPAWAPLGKELQSAFQKLNLPNIPAHRFHLQAAALAIRQELATPVPFSEQRVLFDPALARPQNIPSTNVRLP